MEGGIGTISAMQSLKLEAELAILIQIVIPFIEIGDLGQWRTGDMSERVKVDSVGEERD
jgi:hypothetical protein